MRNFRRIENAPKLAEIMQGYDGRVVRIGTDGSGYFVCGAWSDTLLKDMEWWEAEKKRLKAATIEKYKGELISARKNLPCFKKKLPKLEEAADAAVKAEQECMERVRVAYERREKRRYDLPKILTEHLYKMTKEFEESIKDLSPREMRRARTKYQADILARRRKFNKALTQYRLYLSKQDNADTKELDILSAKAAKATEQLDYLKRQISLAKSKIEVYPSKIREYTRYLNNYTPFMDRSVMEIYESEIHPGETSIIIRGREQGPFWDCEEFNRWKNGGTLSRD